MTAVVDFLLSGFTDNSGEPLSGGKVESYEAGTTTPKTLYTDHLGASPAANPVILDSNGRAQVYGDGSYKLVVRDSSDVLLYTFDNVSFGDIGNKVIFGGTSSGAANTYVVTPSPAVSSLTDGLLVSFEAHQTNTASATLNVSSLGAKTLTANPGQILSGRTYVARYNSTDDTFDLLNVDPGDVQTEAELIAANTVGGFEVVVRQAITLTASLTLTTPVRIAKGGSINTNGNTLTISAPFNAGPYSVFTTTAGEVLFTEEGRCRILPEWFGAIGDQSTDCGSAITKAIAAAGTNTGNVVWFDHGVYLITTQIALANVSNISLAGGGTIYLNAEAAEFELSGTCDRLTFDGLSFVGPGTDWTTPNATIGSASGQTITNLTIKNCTFKSLPFAIHLNANLSGLYENALVSNCRFINIVGTASGHGNGLVMAGPSGRFVGGVVEGCTFEKCNRHSLYVEAVTSVAIVGCSFYKHRADQTTTDTPFFSALNVARSRHVSIVGCVFDSNNDMCVQLYQDDGSGSQDCGPYSVIGCTFRNSTWRDILIGSDSPDSPIYPLRGVIVANNTFVKNGTNAVSAIYYGSGTEVAIHNNFIQALDQTATTTLITIEHPSEANGRSGNVKVHDNIFKAATTSGTIRCITPTSDVCTGTKKFEIYNNLFDIGGSDFGVFYPVTVTNDDFLVTLREDSNQKAGTYNPTVSNASNTDSTPSASAAQYMQVGKTVTVSGHVSVDPTATGTVSFELSLPVASNFAGNQECGGAFGNGTTGEMGAINASSGNDTAVFTFQANQTASQLYNYSFTYQVI